MQRALSPAPLSLLLLLPIMALGPEIWWGGINRHVFSVPVVVIDVAVLDRGLVGVAAVETGSLDTLSLSLSLSLSFFLLIWEDDVCWEDVDDPPPPFIEDMTGRR